VVPQKVAFATNWKAATQPGRNQEHGGKLSIVTLGQDDTDSGYRMQQRWGLNDVGAIMNFSVAAACIRQTGFEVSAPCPVSLSCWFFTGSECGKL